MASGNSDGFEEVNRSLESDDYSERGIGGWLRSIDRSSFIGQSAGLRAGFGVAGGCAAYLFSPVKIGDALEEVPESFSVPLTDSEISMPYSGTELKGKWEHLDEEYLKRNIESFEEVEGFPEVDSFSGLVDAMPEIIDKTPELLAYSADNAAHYASNYAFAALGCMAVDKVTGEYDPKKVVIGGLMTVPMYIVFKEGWYEGGPGVQFDLENMDVRGDMIMDTAGAAHAVYSYHKRKTASENTSPGIIGKMARKAGRAFGRVEKGITGVDKPDRYDLENSSIGETIEDETEIPPDYGNRTAEDLGVEVKSGEKVEREEEVEATD